MSMPVRRACATGLRTKQAWSRPGSSMSSMKRPAPRRRLPSSRRGTARPIQHAASASIVAPEAVVTRSRPLHLLDDRAPLRELLAQILVRALRAKAKRWLEARLDELCLERLVGPFGLRRLVQPLQDRRRCAYRGKDPEEDLRHEIIESLLLRGWNVGRRGEPRGRIDGEDTKLAGSMQRHDLRGDVREDDGDLTAEEVVHGWRNAAIGNVQNVEPAGALLEQLRRNVSYGADAARAVGQSARIGRGIGDQLVDRADRERRVDRDRGRGGGHDRHRADVLERVVGAIVTT